MDDLQFVGNVVTAVITLGGFIAVIIKFIQPINDLRVVIQKLNDNIDTMKSDNEKQEMRMNKHDEDISRHERDIGKLDTRVGKLETRVETLHKNE